MTLSAAIVGTFVCVLYILRMLYMHFHTYRTCDSPQPHTNWQTCTSNISCLLQQVTLICFKLL